MKTNRRGGALASVAVLNTILLIGAVALIAFAETSANLLLEKMFYDGKLLAAVFALRILLFIAVVASSCIAIRLCACACRRAFADKAPQGTQHAFFSGLNAALCVAFLVYIAFRLYYLFKEFEALEFASLFLNYGGLSDAFFFLKVLSVFGNIVYALAVVCAFAANTNYMIKAFSDKEETNE